MRHGEVVVLGLGNPILSDDGAGIHALERLRSASSIPEGVRLVDGGTVGPGLLAAVRGCRRLVVLDAVDAGVAPGTVVRLDLDDGLAPAAFRSVHDLGLATLLDDLRLLGEPPGEVVLLGVQPASLAAGTLLSPEVELGLATLVGAALAELFLRDARAAAETPAKHLPDTLDRGYA